MGSARRQLLSEVHPQRIRLRRAFQHAGDVSHRVATIEVGWRVGADPNGGDSRAPGVRDYGARECTLLRTGERRHRLQFEALDGSLPAGSRPGVPADGKLAVRAQEWLVERLR